MYPDPSDPALTQFPGWAALLKSQAPQLSTLPWQRLQLDDVQAVTHLQQFKREVETQPQAWCRGTGGYRDVVCERGVCVTQLWSLFRPPSFSAEARPKQSGTGTCRTF